jgi:hypothetical protein
MMKVVFIAHPISGNVKNNIEKIINIIRNINILRDEIIPFAPYITDCMALNDANPYERRRGISNTTALFNKGIIDELWLYGDYISSGMVDEIKLAHELSISIIPQVMTITNEQVREILHG